MQKLGERILTACASLCARRPWFILAVSVLLTVLAAWYSTHMKMNTSTDDVLAADLHFRQVEKAYRAKFPKNESLIVIVDGATPADADSAADNLAVRLRDHADLFREVSVPGSQPFFSDNAFLYMALDQLNAVLGQLDRASGWLTTMARDPSLRGIAEIASTPALAPQDAQARERLFDELGQAAAAQAAGEDARPNWLNVFGIQRPQGRPGTRRFVIALPVLDNTSLNRAGPAIDALNEEMQGVTEEEAEGLTMQVTGEPALRHQELQDAFSGATSASVLSFILVALSLIIGVRSGRLIIALLITLIAGGIWTTGLATLFVGQLNLISVAFMVLFIGLGVDFGTHIGLRFLEERKAGHDFEPALRLSLIGEGPAVFLSAVCAALAFLSFVPTSYTGLAEFGIISALGMVVAVIITFTLQPALMAVMPPKVPRWGDVHFGIGAWIQRHFRAILAVSVLISIGALFAATDARVDVNPLNLQNPDAPPVVAYHSLEDDPSTTPYALNVVASDLEEARTRAARLAEVPGVAHVATIEDLLPKQQDEKLQRIAATRKTLGPQFFDTSSTLAPPSPAELASAFERLRAAAVETADSAPAGSALQAAAERLRDGLAAFAEQRGTDTETLTALQEALVGSAPDIVGAMAERLSSARALGIADVPPEMRRDWVAPDGDLRLQIQPAGNIGTPEGFEEFARKIQAVEPGASGPPVTITEAGEAIIQSFGEAVLYTTIAIALIVLFLRRSLSDLVLILLPLAIASLWTVAGSALLDLPFNFANVIVIPLLIGLGVAGSVHIVVRHRELEHEGGPNKDVLGTSTSLAVLVAQLNNVAAFATLAISDHRGLYSMGLLLGLAVMLTICVCLIVLPAGLVALDRWKTKRSAAPPAR